MMATTHVFAALAVAVVVAAVAPQFAGVVAAAAILGGLFPDFDLVAGHRRTLHFPVYYAVFAVLAGLVAAIVPTDVTVGLAAFLLAAALHSGADLLGGGLELKPWRATSDRAVYSHYHGRWLAPRRWVRYDGAPEDLALAAVLALPALFVFDGRVRSVVIVMLVVSIGYTVVRKRLANAGEWLFGRVPASVLSVVPQRVVPVEDDRERTAE
ncbi:hypothetical protein [Halopiger djelfimassiliensis]|uniref:hypothetical protein n=1 Tax=Halopiger djelfimassiliensis TaxID=1293047 RepID=UPI000677B0A8|nr:hypothetical protein [Halopiger djelfimassiliensis]